MSFETPSWRLAVPSLPLAVRRCPRPAVGLALGVALLALTGCAGLPGIGGGGASGAQAVVGGLTASQREMLAAAATLDGRDGALKKDPTARLDNQVALLLTLASLGPGGLEQAVRETSGRQRAWVELAQALAPFGSASPQADAAFRKWQSGRLVSPALPGLPTAYFAALAGGYPTGAKLLVLLPKGGPFGAPAQAIRDGMQAAYNADAGANRPPLDDRDTSGAAGAKLDAGVKAGATLAVGPLQREDVAALAQRPSLPVPTLALNRAGGPSVDNLYQFALAPEDEAGNAADYAWAAGLRRAAILFPKDPWGERMAEAFRGQWRKLGGSFAEQRSYTPDLKDYAESAAAVANADLVFLVATGGDARRLWSALQTGAPGVPVIATSHVYDGDSNPERDGALAGLWFVDIPWLLEAGRSDALSRKALRDRLPNVHGPLARLYAMGIDAYRLAPRISAMGQQRGTFFPGSTGGLSVDGQGQVRRQLTLARFAKGGPEVMAGIIVPAPAAGKGAAPKADADAGAKGGADKGEAPKPDADAAPAKPDAKPAPAPDAKG